MFTCSPHVCVGFLTLLWPSASVQYMHFGVDNLQYILATFSEKNTKKDSFTFSTFLLLVWYPKLQQVFGSR